MEQNPTSNLAAMSSLLVDAFHKSKTHQVDLEEFFEVNDLALPAAMVVHWRLGDLNATGRQQLVDAWMTLCEQFGAPADGEYWALDDLPGFEGAFED